MSGLFIGLLSGTSVDAVDAALVDFAAQPRVIATHSREYPPALRQELLALATPGPNELDRLGEADVQVGRHFARTAGELLAKAGKSAAQVRAIGSHGQTVRHRPTAAHRFTMQIGDPNVIAVETGIAVVADFRRKDIALGGQGAPLVPAFHAAMFSHPRRDRAVVNIGGIANVTLLPRGATAPVRGFDTGPGNTLLDAWCRQCLQEPMDRDGSFARRGRVHPPLLRAMRDDPYFRASAPKSTGPEYFSLQWLEPHLAQAGSIAAEDVQATLLALTAGTITDAIQQGDLEHPEVFICGGGARNPGLMAALAANLDPSPVAPTDELGIAHGWVEALAFAWLARQRLEGAPGNCPDVTGASRPATLGGLWLP